MPKTKSLPPFVEIVAASQSAALDVLLYEMEALGQIMPHAHETDADRIKHEAEIEADLDNMPV